MTARVGICYPAGDQVSVYFAYDLARMFAWTAAQRPDVEIRQYLSTGSLIPQQRELLVAQALRDECTHVLFVDTDMQFPRDTIARLLAHDRDFVAANYTAKRPPFNPVAWYPDGAHCYTGPHSAGLEPVALTGLGCALISCAVLRRIAPPRFMIGWIPDDAKHVGEDIYLCEQLKKLGVELVVDHDLSRDVSHVGAFAFETGHAHVAAEAAEAAASGAE